MLLSQGTLRHVLAGVWLDNLRPDNECNVGALQLGGATWLYNPVLQTSQDFVPKVLELCCAL